MEISDVASAQDTDEEPIRHGFCIYVCTAVGQTPVWWDKEKRPVVYETELAAQREIAEGVINRLEQFMRGECDFEDAISNDEYIVPVSVFADGSITDEDGNYFTPRLELAHKNP